uniref:Uncharacterized protein n=1 Tax=Capra hircus TaxID=9925 RepID=A0A8C2NSQ4_CAPHI
MSESGEISEFGYIMELLARGKLSWRRGYLCQCCGKTAELVAARGLSQIGNKSGKRVKT